jgi:hypothetical protein
VHHRRRMATTLKRLRLLFVNIHHLVHLETNPVLPSFSLEEKCLYLNVPSGLIRSTDEIYDAYDQEIHHSAAKLRPYQTTSRLDTMWGTLWTYPRTGNVRVYYMNRFLPEADQRQLVRPLFS